MARPTADTAQITFRLPLEWLERADEVAASLALAGRPMGRTDGVRALIAAGLAVYSGDTGAMVERVSRSLQVTREEALRAALEAFVGALPAGPKVPAKKRAKKK